MSRRSITKHPLSLAAAGLAVLLLGAGVTFWLVARGSSGEESGGGHAERTYLPDSAMAAFFGEPLAIMPRGAFGEDDASVRVAGVHPTGRPDDPAVQLRVRYPADSASRLASREDDA